MRSPSPLHRFTCFLFLLSILSSLSTAYTDIDVATVNNAGFVYSPDSDSVYYCRTANILGVCDTSGTCSDLITGIVAYGGCPYVITYLTPTHNGSLAYVSGSNGATNMMNITEISPSNNVYSYTIGPVTGAGDLIFGGTLVPYLTAVGAKHIVLSFTTSTTTGHTYGVINRTGSVIEYTQILATSCATGGCSQSTLSVGGKIGARFRSFETYFAGPVYDGDVVRYGVGGRGVSTTSYYMRWYAYNDAAYTGQLTPLGTDTMTAGKAVVIDDGTIYSSGGGYSHTLASGIMGGGVFDTTGAWPPSTAYSQSMLETAVYDVYGNLSVFNATYIVPQIGSDYRLVKYPLAVTDPYTLILVNGDTVVDNASISTVNSDAFSTPVITTGGVIVYRPTLTTLRFRSGLPETPPAVTPLLWANLHEEKYISLYTRVLARLGQYYITGDWIVPSTVSPISPNISDDYGAAYIFFEDSLSAPGDSGFFVTSRPVGDELPIIVWTDADPGHRYNASIQCECGESSATVTDDYSSISNSALSVLWGSTCTVTTIPYVTDNLASCDGSATRNVYLSTGTGDVNIDLELYLPNASSINWSLRGASGVIVDGNLSRNDLVVTVVIDGDAQSLALPAAAAGVLADAGVVLAFTVSNTDASVVVRSLGNGQAVSDTVAVGSSSVRGIDFENTIGVLYGGLNTEIDTPPSPGTPLTLSPHGSYWYALAECTITGDDQCVRINYGNGQYVQAYIDLEATAGAVAAIEEAERAAAIKEAEDFGCSQLHICTKSGRMLAGFVVVLLVTIIMGIVIWAITGTGIWAGLAAVMGGVIAIIMMTAIGWIPVWVAVVVALMTAGVTAVFVRNTVGGDGGGR